MEKGSKPGNKIFKYLSPMRIGVMLPERNREVYAGSCIAELWMVHWNIWGLKNRQFGNIFEERVKVWSEF